MPGATFSRLKNWVPEILTNTDLNAEIDNILNNLNTQGLDDYSTNAAQMRLQTDPGSVGAESLATSLAGELERLRFVLARLIGPDVNYWYETPPSTITDLVAALGTGLPTNRLASGATTSRSSQLNVIIPNGSAASLVIDGSPTSFEYRINGVAYSITTDLTVTGLSLAPSSGNTCAIETGPITSQQWTKFWGQYGTKIVVQSMGAAITALIGQIAAFKHDDGAGNIEYFTALVEDSTHLSFAQRGAYFGAAGAAKPAVAFDAGDTITLLKLSWIFATTAGGISVSYTTPTVSASEPALPSVGDYWFDLLVNQWKTFNSTAWVAANATLIGITMQDTSACVAAKTLDAYKTQNSNNSMELYRTSNSTVQVRDTFSEVTLFGKVINFQSTRPIWDMATNLDTGLTEAASTYYYFYMTEDGLPVISDQAPALRRDLSGLYFPTETWRCLGYAYNNAASNLIEPVFSFLPSLSPTLLLGDATAYVADPNTDLVIAENIYPNSIYAVYFDGADGSTANAFPASSGSFGALTSLNAVPAPALTLPPGLYRARASATHWNNGAIGAATAIFLKITGGPTTLTTASYATTTSGDRRTMTIADGFFYSPIETTISLEIMATTVHANLQYNSYMICAERIDETIGSPI